jgi:hypothetical protein
MGDSRQARPAPDRETLVALLQRWPRGEIDHWGVVVEAEEIADSLWDDAGRIPVVVKGDPDSIAVAVLSLLATAYASLILSADVPTLLEFLGTAAGDELRGWERFDAYWRGVDMNAREREANWLYFGKATGAE